MRLTAVFGLGLRPFEPKSFAKTANDQFNHYFLKMRQKYNYQEVVPAEHLHLQRYHDHKSFSDKYVLL